jgi:predicted nucleotidyltransferase
MKVLIINQAEVLQLLPMDECIGVMAYAIEALPKLLARKMHLPATCGTMYGNTMAQQSVLDIVRAYLQTVNEAGIQASRAVLFGSWSRGDAHPDSDIDVIIVAPEFDGQQGRQLVDRLWELRAGTREAWRIEPIPCGERQWVEDDTNPIIEIARREGEVVALVPHSLKPGVVFRFAVVKVQPHLVSRVRRQNRQVKVVCQRSTSSGSARPSHPANPSTSE